MSVDVDFSDRKRSRSNTKSGRFYLWDYQHNYLVEKGGRYVLAVMEGDQIIHTRMVLASRLSLGFDGCMTLTSRTVFRALGACC
jgi:hypothetical protein